MIHGRLNIDSVVTFRNEIRTIINSQAHFEARTVAISFVFCSEIRLRRHKLKIVIEKLFPLAESVMNSDDHFRCSNIATLRLINY